MKKSVQSKFSIIKALLCVLAFLLLAAMMMLFYIQRLNRREFVYAQESKRGFKKEGSVHAETSIPEGKHWHEGDGRQGAQYDWTIYNDTDFDFTGWRVKADCIPGYKVDSLWSGKFSFEYSDAALPPFDDRSSPNFANERYSTKDTILVSAPDEDYNIVIPAHGFIKFGMVMYTGKKNSPDDFFKGPLEISGRHIYRLRQFKSFWFLAALVFLTLVALVIFVSIEIGLRRQSEEYEKRKKYYHDIIIQAFKTFANFVDAKDAYTRGHSSRVGIYAREMGRRLNLNEEEQETLYWEGLMHDVGKITIKDEILKKPGALTLEEFNTIKNHTIGGYKILKDFTSMQTLKDIALSHHERYDGSGYPNGLKGKEIPFEARIIGVCDSFDAMNSDRCYRMRLPKETIIEEFRRGAGKQFDPQLSEIMIQMIEDGWIDRFSKEPDDMKQDYSEQLEELE